MTNKKDIINIESYVKEKGLRNEIKNRINRKNYFLIDKGDSSKINKTFLNLPINIERLDQKILYSKEYIFYSFSNKKMTKYLQKCLINLSNEKITFIEDELQGNFREVIKNRNGNYFFSNLINVCGHNNRIKILEELSNLLSEDCIDQFGTYPIQNLIQLASSEYEFKLLMASFDKDKNILLPSLNLYGSLVIQKLIRHIPDNLRKKFNSKFVKFDSVLSKDTYGIFPLEGFIKYTNDEAIQK